MDLLLEEESKPDRKNKINKFFFTISSIIIFIFPIISIMIIKIDDFGDTAFVFIGLSKLINYFDAKLGSFYFYSIIGNILLIFVYILILISIGIVMSSSSRKHSNPGRYNNLQLPYETFKRQLKAQRAILIINTLMSMLGLGDSVFDLTRLVDHVLTIINKTYTTDKAYALLIISIFENGFKCIYHLCLLIFIIYHKRYENVFNCLVLRVFIGSLSICCLSQWLFIIFQEIYHERKNVWFQNRTTCNESATLLNSFTEVERFLYPLGIEFRISCFIELFFISLSKRRSGNVLVKIFFNNTKIHGNQRIFYQEINHSGNESVEERNENASEKSKKSKFDNFFMVTSMLISIIIVSISVVVIFFQNNNFRKNSNLVIAISELCETVFMITSIIYIVFLLVKMHSRNMLASQIISTNHKMSNDKKIDFIFLFLSQISLLIFCLLASLGSIKSFWMDAKEKEMSNYVIYLIITSSITSLIQSILQSIYIWIIRYKIVLNKSYIKILILLNFGIWLFDTFSAIKFVISNIQIRVYGKPGWEILSTIFIPLSLFYRLHSAIVLIKLKAETYSSNALLIED